MLAPRASDAAPLQPTPSGIPAMLPQGGGQH
jgi:hypothetical protein